MIFKKCIVLSIIPFISQWAWCQGADDSLALCLARIEQYNSQYPQEKVYLHFDNTSYFRGETIWFKAYVIRNDSLRFTNLSRVLYVELITPEGDVVDTHRLKIENGQACGCIKLDRLLGSGFYEVRAYTRYMTNWGTSAAFSRVFPVFNAPKTEGDYSYPVIRKQTYRKRLSQQRQTDSNATVQADGWYVSFYPEGGRLVKGLCSRVAFELRDKNGAPIDTTLLLMADGEQLAQVRTLREGRGIFACQPDGRRLSLQLGRQRFCLPACDDEGCVMSVSMVDDDFMVSVSCTPDRFGRTMWLALLNSGGSIDACTPVATDVGQSCRFSRSQMSEGVNQLLLLDNGGHVVAERMVFVYPDTTAVNLSISTSVSRIIPYSKITLQARTRPRIHFSISVRDAATDMGAAKENAATWLLLGSDLKGYIHNPYYYLESDDNDHRQATDLLMMVQGWRCRTAQQMMTNEPIIAQPVEDRMYLYGKVRPEKKKQDVGGIGLSMALFNAQGMSFRGETMTRDDGSYAFAMPDCEGEWQLLFNARDEKGEGQKVRVGIDRHFSPPARQLSCEETRTEELPSKSFFATNIEEETLQQPPHMTISEQKHLLGNVDVKGKRRYANIREAWESERDGAYMASICYDCDKAADEYADQGLGMPGIFEWLQARNSFFSGNPDPAINSMDGWVIEPNRSGRTQNNYIGEKKEGKSNNNEPKQLIIGDGMYYKNRPVVWILNNVFLTVTHCPASIKSSDILYMTFTSEPLPCTLDNYKSVYISEADDASMPYLQCPKLLGYSPVTVFLYTHHDITLPQKGIRRTHFYGYDRLSTFEMPDYSLLPPAADHRRTLYWNPDVTTDAQGQATITFYNNSSCRQFSISAEGITAEGRAIIYEQ